MTRETKKIHYNNYYWREQTRQEEKINSMLTSTILYLRNFHKGVEYFEPIRSRFKSLPAKKNQQRHQGGLGDSEDESDAKMFFVSDSETGG